MAFVMPLFVALMMGQIESARLGMVAQVLSTAAREGCRVAIIDGNVNKDVTDRINSVLSGGGIISSNVVVTQTPADCTTVKSSSTSNTITVKLSVPYSKVSWVRTPFFLKTAQVTATAIMSSERP